MNKFGTTFKGGEDDILSIKTQLYNLKKKKIFFDSESYENFIKNIHARIEFLEIQIGLRDENKSGQRKKLKINDSNEIMKNDIKIQTLFTNLELQKTYFALDEENKKFKTFNDYLKKKFDENTYENAKKIKNLLDSTKIIENYLEIPVDKKIILPKFNEKLKKILKDTINYEEINKTIQKMEEKIGKIEVFLNMPVEKEKGLINK